MDGWMDGWMRFSNHSNITFQLGPTRSQIQEHRPRTPTRADSDGNFSFSLLKLVSSLLQKREREMDRGGGGGGGGGGSSSRYSLQPARFCNEDILICVDVDLESQVEMKVSGPKGRPITRLDSIKQAILLFVNAKLAINPDHRFAFSVLSQSASWLRKELSSEVDSAIAAVRALSADSSYGHADLTQLFRVAAHEAKKSRAQSRIFRVILIYCRSSVPPVHQWPAKEKLFTLDVVYLHDKPNPENCPQKVYDALVDALEHVSEFEGYIFESGQGLARVLFRHLCVLLAHPQQRCVQDYIDVPKSLAKKPTATDGAPSEEIIVVSGQ